MSESSEARYESETHSTNSVDQLTERNVTVIRELEEAAKEERTRTDRFAGSYCQLLRQHDFRLGTRCLVRNLDFDHVIPRLPHIDPFPFTFLTLVVSLEAIFLSTFILISQNHDSKISERRNHVDLQINLLSEQENTQMLVMLRAIAEKVGADLGRDDQVEALSEETKPQRLVKQIKAREKD